MKDKNTVVVTGGAGFIGSHLCEHLIGNGKRVICIDNFNNYYDPGIKADNIAYLITNQSFVLYKNDIRHKDDLEMIFEHYNPGLVIHLAAMPGVRPSIENPALYNDVNIQGTLGLLEVMRKYSVTDMVFASSSSVYGNTSRIPFTETDCGDSQISPYAWSKRAGELLCKMYTNLYGFNITCLRFFTVYGPRQRPDLAIHRFTNNIMAGEPVRLYGDGLSSRDYTFIGDIIPGIINASGCLKGFNIYNLGESRTITLGQMVQTIEDVTGIKARKEYFPAQPGDVEITYADISKARNEIGYNPKVGFREGIVEFIKWKSTSYSSSNLFSI
jgi:UDP-glucuronate 4-epimerase